MKRVTLAFVLIVLAIGFNSCEKYVILPPVLEEDVTFSGTIQAIFNTNCTSCHNGVNQNPDLTEGNSYAALNAYTPTQGGQTIDLETPENSVIYTMALDGAHGYFSLSGKAKASILKWIQDGALND